MGPQSLVRSLEGRQFRLGEDIYTIKRPTSAADTTSLTHLTVADGSITPPHTHERYEETFYILEGELEFTLGTDTFFIRAGDYLRAEPGVRHGFANKSGRPVRMLFTFTPGGIEELFYEFRTDDGPFDAAAYLAKAELVAPRPIYEFSERALGD